MTTYEEFPEPQGCANLPGFVKSNPKNNKSYIEKFAEVWDEDQMEAIRNADRKLEELIPGYNIGQIKSKFGQLRFYYDAPLDEDSDYIPYDYSAAEKIVAEAEEEWYKATYNEKN